MTYELAVGLRYLKSRRRQTFISLISVISVGGVAVGVMVAVGVLEGMLAILVELAVGVLVVVVVEPAQDASCWSIEFFIRSAA